MQPTENTAEQAMLGDFPKTFYDAILGSGDAHNNQKMQLLSDPKRAVEHMKIVFDVLTSAH